MRAPCTLESIYFYQENKKKKEKKKRMNRQSLIRESTVFISGFNNLIRGLLSNSVAPCSMPFIQLLVLLLLLFLSHLLFTFYCVQWYICIIFVLCEMARFCVVCYHSDNMQTVLNVCYVYFFVASTVCLLLCPMHAIIIYFILGF